MNDAPPSRVGDYELLELIGAGAQGRVFKARCTARTNPNAAPEELVAVKILTGPPAGGADGEREQRQAADLLRLNHPNLVRYRDTFLFRQGAWADARCLVMDLIEGESLQDRIRRHPHGLPWEDVKPIVQQTLAGLLYARSQGITHRDLKPANIIINQDGAIKLIDFEIARRHDSGDASTAGWKGTFDYMAPDFVTLDDFHGDEASDIFSLGVCLYEAITGRLPYPPLGANASVAYFNRWRGANRPAAAYDDESFRVLSGLAAAVGKALEFERPRRHASFADLLADLLAVSHVVIGRAPHETYELMTLLGQGGFGEVFQARRRRDNRLVAAKHLFANRYSKRFLKEARVLRQYPHEHLVQYVDFLDETDAAGGEPRYFLIMELLPGMPLWTLRGRIKLESGGLDPREAAALFISYLEALQFLHEHPQPIIHRDIKPANLYAPPGRPDRAKIFDLGIARDVTGTATAGQVPGTLDYMAPEFAASGDDRGSPQSDLYALALSFVEALTGQPAFPRFDAGESKAVAQFLERAGRDALPDFQAPVFRDFPGLARLLRKALARDPADRHASASAMRADLQAVLDDMIRVRGPLPPPPPLPDPDTPFTPASPSASSGRRVTTPAQAGNATPPPPRPEPGAAGNEETLPRDNPPGPASPSRQQDPVGASAPSRPTHPESAARASAARRPSAASAGHTAVSIARNRPDLQPDEAGGMRAARLATLVVLAVVLMAALGSLIVISSRYQPASLPKPARPVQPQAISPAPRDTQPEPPAKDAVTPQPAGPPMVIARPVIPAAPAPSAPVALPAAPVPARGSIRISVQASQPSDTPPPTTGWLRHGETTPGRNVPLPYLLRDLPPGPVTLSLRVDGYRQPAPQLARVAPGETNGVVFELIPLPPPQPATPAPAASPAPEPPSAPPAGEPQRPSRKPLPIRP